MECKPQAGGFVKCCPGRKAAVFKVIPVWRQRDNLGNRKQLAGQRASGPLLLLEFRDFFHDGVGI